MKALKKVAMREGGPTDHKFTSKHAGGIISVESVSDEARECSVASIRVARHGEQQQRVNGEHEEVA